MFWYASGWFILGWLWRRGKLGKLLSVGAALIYAVVVLAVIGTAAGTGNHNQVAASNGNSGATTSGSSSSSASSDQSGTDNGGSSGSGDTSGSVTLVDKQGSGAWTSPTFNPTSDWQIAYNYDCSNAGGKGNFIINVYGPGNTPSADGVNELKASGSGTTSIHDVTGSGTYIEVNSECNWNVTASGPGDAATSSSGSGSSTSGATLVDKQGSGQWTSPTFNAPGDWQIQYSYDCSNFGSAGNFQVSVYGPGNSPTADGVNELKKSGGGTTYIHDASGNGAYFSVNSECDWHVTATS